MRGYFGIGVDRLHKPNNLGALLRTAHAFGASFFFTVGSQLDLKEARKVDTSAGEVNLPVYDYPSVDQMNLPRSCLLIGVELTDDAVALPSFYHPPAAAYVLGPEGGNLSSTLMARCHRVVQIPTKFCLNVGIAGAIVMYDRLLATQRVSERVLSSLQTPSALTPHTHGKPVFRRKSPLDDE